MQISFVWIICQRQVSCYAVQSESGLVMTPAGVK
ncbi:hypothetical protein CEXT_452801, partial [Caerostris extrusa]